MNVEQIDLALDIRVGEGSIHTKAGIVHEDFVFTGLSSNCRDQSVCRIGAGQLRSDDVRGNPESGAAVFGNLCESLFIPPGKDDVEAAGCKFQREGLADPGGGSGNDGPLSGLARRVSRS